MRHLFHMEFTSLFLLIFFIFQNDALVTRIPKGLTPWKGTNFLRWLRMYATASEASNQKCEDEVCSTKEEIIWCDLWKNARFAPGEREVNARRFFKWCQESNFFDGEPAVCIKDGGPERGLGLYATRNVQADEILVTIPRNKIFSSDNIPPPLEGELNEVSEKLWEAQLRCELQSSSKDELPPPVKLALNLIYHKSLGKNSDFHAYLSALPRSYNELPAFWVDEELQWLKGTIVYNDCILLRKRLLKEYNLLVDAVQKHISPNFSLSDWCWARATALSRAYSVGGSYCLCPLLDMSNHDDNIKYAVLGSNGEFVEKGTTLFVSEQKYSKGDEVMSTYGNILNWQKLFSFGYATDGNGKPLDGATELKVQFDHDDTHLMEKNMVLEAMKKKGEIGGSLFFRVSDFQQISAENSFELAAKAAINEQVQQKFKKLIFEQALPIARLHVLNERIWKDVFGEIQSHMLSQQSFLQDTWNYLLKISSIAEEQKAVQVLTGCCRSQVQELMNSLESVPKVTQGSTPVDVNLSSNFNKDKSVFCANVLIGELITLQVILDLLKKYLDEIKD
mmetsp:Transcript_25502/g.33321  ORF Transcript_25502/g.33321 Transcript_25502/m.33321 type:complete len:563 (+) Transcript_25502:83-1771(+)